MVHVGQFPTESWEISPTTPVLWGVIYSAEKWDTFIRPAFSFEFGDVGWSQPPTFDFNSITTQTHHYNEVIMSTVPSQITSVSIVCSTVGSGTDQRRHQSSTSLAFVLKQKARNAENVSIWWRHHDPNPPTGLCTIQIVKYICICCVRVLK